MARPWSKPETDLAIRLRMQGRTFAEVREKLIENHYRPRSLQSVMTRFDRCASDAQSVVSQIIRGINMRRGRGVPIHTRRVWAHEARALVARQGTTQ